ncbi:protein FAR1-RELATED SEQUENCE 5-like [Spinacia oleracea]|uniref:Protein FAR1-RELATED SEQUENCE 5-like n=1 Tax=Spinacia oleracea TaxID=3562 RepID=A0ABM3RS22_SPIOL|nr:protein FAR1-RELATED SEQUENCE 5-like [Spinacia oleracea]
MDDDLIDLNIDLNRAIEEKLYNYDENLENHREVYDVEDEVEDEVEGTSQQVMVPNHCIEEGSIIHSIDTNHDIFENPNNEQEQNIDKELDGRKNRYKEGTTIVNGKYFYCSAAGIRDPPKNKELKNEDDQSDAKKKEMRKRIMITRTKCEAQIFAKKNENGDFEIEKHVVVHNHPLTREISNYLHRLERQMTEPKKEAIEAMSECGLRPIESYRYMSTETGGDDCQIDGKDSQTLVNKLYDLPSIDPEFLFRVRLNDEGKVECLFWRDSMMREDYKIYGDVLAMGGKHPISIFTDQDAAIAAGIQQVFPSSRHRLCLWHLSKNANSRFGLLKSDKNFKNAFYKCLSGCITPNDFEETWKSMINTFKLEKDNWFNTLYGLKEKWCTALSKDFFYAGILSSQRSESTNHAVGFKANKSTTLTEFYSIFQATINRWRETEEKDDFDCTRGIPTSELSMSAILKQAANVYTITLCSSGK